VNTPQILADPSPPQALAECIALCAGIFESVQKQIGKAPLADIEKKVWEQLSGVGRIVLKAFLNGEYIKDCEREYQCRQCHKKFRIMRRSQARNLKTLFGIVSYNRAYGICDRCGLTAAPMDQELGLPDMGMSMGLRQRVCHAAVVARSFEDAQEILKVHSGIEISSKHVRAVAEDEGKMLSQSRAHFVKLCQDGQLKLTPPESPELIVVCADGGRVQTRQPSDEDRWKEDKVGIVYDAVARPNPKSSAKEYEGARAQTKTFVATMQPWEAFGWMLRLEAEVRGYLKAKAKLFLADGAKHIRDLKNFHFHDAIFILDWYHAAEHLSNCAKAFFGEGTAETRQWYEKFKQKLWDGQRDEIIEELQKLSKQLGEPKPQDSGASPRVILHRDAYSYFPNNKDAMDYPQFRSKGWPIGSGVAEGAVKQFALRLKGSEKFWNVSDRGAEEMLALCALYHCEDGRWDLHWKERAQPIRWG